MDTERNGRESRVKYHLPVAFRLLIVTAILIILVCSCSKEKAEEPPKPVVRPIKMETIMAAGDMFSRQLPGVVRASKRADLAFEVSGPLEELPVEEGQAVKKGQLIARIMPRDYKTALDKAKALALEAEQQFQRYKELYVRNQVSKAEFDRYKSERDVTRARQKAAEDALGDTELKAPFAGLIARRYVENFEKVQAKQPIVSLQDVSSIEILLDVPEDEMLRIKEGGTFEAQAEFAAAPGIWHPLVLKEFSTEADPKTRTYQVTMQMDQPKGIQAYSGMTTTVRGKAQTGTETDQALTVPAIAVVSDKENGSFVWGVDPESMRVKRRVVTPGEPVGEDRVQILKGLQSGDTIAISGISQLKDGLEVRTMPEY